MPPQHIMRHEQDCAEEQVLYIDNIDYCVFTNKKGRNQSPKKCHKPIKTTACSRG